MMIGNLTIEKKRSTIRLINDVIACILRFFAFCFVCVKNDEKIAFVGFTFIEIGVK